MNDDLMTIAELAEKEGKDQSTIRRWIAECALETADEKRIMPSGQCADQYSYERLLTQMSGLRDKKLVEQLSKPVQELIVRGIMTKDMSLEQLAEVCLQQQLQIEDKTKQLIAAETKKIEAQERQLKASAKFKRHEEFVALLAEEYRLEKKAKNGGHKEHDALYEVRQQLRYKEQQVREDGYDVVSYEDFED